MAMLGVGERKEPLKINFSYVPRQESNSITLVLGVGEGGASMNAINQLTKGLTSGTSALYFRLWST